jgi:hypothetical protein
MINETKVGPLAVGDGTTNTARAAKTGETVVTDAHGRYYEPTSRGAMFSGSTSGRDTTIGLATTYTGLVLSNPIGSGVNLVLNKVGYAFSVAFAATSVIGLMTGYSPTTDVIHTTPVTPKNQRIGSAAGIGKLDSAATITTPVLNTVLGVGLTGAITTNPSGCAGLVDLEGSIILAPGSFCAFYTSTVAGASAANYSIQWEEVSII